MHDGDKKAVRKPHEEPITDDPNADGTPSPGPPLPAQLPPPPPPPPTQRTPPPVQPLGLIGGASIGQASIGDGELMK